MEVYIFFFVTAVIFTLVGHSMGTKKMDKALVETAIGTCIDGLIKEGYLKTSGYGDSMKILKWDEVDVETDRS
jgi:hypothetical protein